MPNRMYEKGARKEREIVNLFRKKGCYACRSAGSHSRFDVIAIDGDVLRLIQVKGSRIKLKALEIPTNITVRQELWYKKDRKEWIIEEMILANKSE